MTVLLGESVFQKDFYLAIRDIGWIDSRFGRDKRWMEDTQVDFLFSLIYVMTMSNEIRLAASAPCDTSTEWLSRFCVLEPDNDEAMVVERSEARSINVIPSFLRRPAALLSRFDHTHLR